VEILEFKISDPSCESTYDISLLSLLSRQRVRCASVLSSRQTPASRPPRLGHRPGLGTPPPIAVFVNFGLIWLDAPIAKKPPIGKHLLSTSSKLFYADDRLRWMCGCGIGDFWHRPAEHIVWRSLIYSMLISRNIGHQRLSESRSAWPLDGSPMATYIQ
jgi:hypothetical protein